MGNSGAVIKDKRGAGKEEADEDADAADMIKGEREAPLISRFKSEGADGGQRICEEVVER